jgi:hypothetical protein
MPGTADEYGIKVRQRMMEQMREGRPMTGPVLREAARQAIRAVMQAAKVSGTGPTPAEITAAVRGAFEAVVLNNGDPVRTSVEIMHGVVEASQDLYLDNEFVMRAALVGVAAVGKQARQGTLINIRGALDEAFMGLGEVFEGVCREQAGKPIA